MTRACLPDAGLLALRIGAGVSLVLLLWWPPAWDPAFGAAGAGRLGSGALALTALVLTLGLYGRTIALALAALSAWVAWVDLRLGLDPLVMPARAAEFAILFSALGLAGPGRFSLDHARRAPRPPRSGHGC